jgi:sugar phosphate permease
VQLGYKAAQAQLMTIPVYTVACLCTLIAAYVSDRIGKRHPMVITGFSIALAGLVMLYKLPKDRMPGVRYFACLVMMGGIYMAFPGVITWNCKSKLILPQSKLTRQPTTLNPKENATSQWHT